MSELSVNKNQHSKLNKKAKKGLKNTSLYFALLIIFSIVCLVSTVTYCWYKMFFLNDNNVLNTISMTMDVTLYDAYGNDLAMPNQESTDTNYYTTTDWILNEPSKTNITRYFKLDNTGTVDINAYLQFYMNYEDGSIGEARYNNIVKTSYFYIDEITSEVQAEMASMNETAAMKSVASNYSVTVSELNALEGKMPLTDIDKIQSLGEVHNASSSYYRVQIWSTSTSVTLSSFGMSTYIYSRVNAFEESETTTTYSVATETALKEAASNAKAGDVINLTTNISTTKPLTFIQAVTLNLNGFTLEIDGDLNFDYASSHDSYVNMYSSSRLVVSGDINIDIPSSSLFIVGNSKTQILLGRITDGEVVQGVLNIKTKFDKTNDKSGFVQENIIIKTLDAVDALGNKSYKLADYNVLSNTCIFIGESCQVGTIYSYADAVNIQIINEGEIEKVDASSIKFNETDNFVNVWDGTSVATSINGTGTITDPYYIGTCAQLKYFANCVNSNADGNHYSGVYFELAMDLDLNGNEWVPIGTPSNPFKGIFDANGYTISNFVIAENTQSYTGLFGYVVNGTLKNLGVLDFVISSNRDFEGGIAGLVENGTVNGCYAIGTITSTKTNGKIGGLVGYSKSGTRFTNCYTIINISVEAEGDSLVGGMVGKIETGAIISACFTQGTIDASLTSSSRYTIGGFVGENQGSIKLSYSTIDITLTGTGGSVKAGGMIGVNGNTAETTICYIDGDIDVQTSGSDIYIAGGVADNNGGAVFSYVLSMGTITSTQDTKLAYICATGTGSVIECFSYSTQKILYNDTEIEGLDKSTIVTNASETVVMNNLIQPYWRIYGEGSIANGYVWWVSDGIPFTLYYQNVTSYTITVDDDIWFGETESEFKGEGTEEIPYEISTGAHLAYLREKVKDGNTYEGMYFILANNIDLNGNEWEPIGDSTHPFSGIVDGKEFKVFNFTITDEYNGYYGLFGYLKNASFVDITITNINFKINSTLDSYCGGLAGYADSVYVKNCEVKGTISLTSTGSTYVGSLFGYFAGSQAVNKIKSNVTLTIQNNSTSTSSTMTVGGLIGYADTIEIKNSYTLGDIEAKCKQATAYVSGLLANVNTSAVIKYSYSSLKITTESAYNFCKAGGIVGYAKNTTISACYSNSTILAKAYYSAYSGSLVGEMYSSTITDSYSSGLSKAYYVGAGSSYPVYSGGLVGYVDANSTVTKSFSKASVQAISVTGNAYGGGLVGYNAGTLSYSYAVGDTTGRGSNRTSSFSGGLVGDSTTTTFTYCYRYDEQYIARFTFPNSSSNTYGTSASLESIYTSLVSVYYLSFDATDTSKVETGYVWFTNKMHPYLYHEMVELIDEEDVDKYNTSVLIGGSFRRGKYQFNIINRGLIGLNNTSTTDVVIIVPTNSSEDEVIIKYILDKYYLSYDSTIFVEDTEYPKEERLQGGESFTYLNISYEREIDTTDISYTDDEEESTLYNLAYDSAGNTWKFIALENDTARLIDLELASANLSNTTLDIPTHLTYREVDYGVSSVATNTITDENVASITQINIGANITNLQVNAFNSMQINNITLDSGNTSYRLLGSLDTQDLALISYDSTTLCELFIQNGDITEYNLPFSVVNIKYDAISSITTLKTLYSTALEPISVSQGTLGTLFALDTTTVNGVVIYNFNGYSIHVLQSLEDDYVSKGILNSSAEVIKATINEVSYTDAEKNEFGEQTVTMHYAETYSSSVGTKEVTAEVCRVYFAKPSNWSSVYCTGFYEDYFTAQESYTSSSGGRPGNNSTTTVSVSYNVYLAARAEYTYSGRNPRKYTSTWIPGASMTKTDKTYNGLEVWYIDVPKGLDDISFNESASNYTASYTGADYVGGDIFVSTGSSTLSKLKLQEQSSVDRSSAKYFYKLTKVDGVTYAEIINGITEHTTLNNLAFPDTIDGYDLLPGTSISTAKVYLYSATKPTTSGYYYYINDRGKYVIWNI